MRKWFWILLIALMVFDAAGCATVQKKFTRKKKEPKHVPTAIYLQEGPYQKKYSNAYYYKSHYTFWKSWHEDLLKQLGGNHKKVARCAQEASGHLNEMYQYLVPEKQSSLKPQVDALNKIAKQIESRQFTQSEEGPMLVELQKIKRIVSNDYYFNKVQNDLLPDKIDLGDEAA